MVNDEPDQPADGHEFGPLENSPPYDPYAPVDYPADALPPPGTYPPPGMYPPPGPYGPPGTYPPAGGFPPPGGQPPPGYPPYPTGYAPYQGGYPGYPGYDPYATGRPPGTNGKAIAALVTGLVSVTLCGCFIPSIAALILGFIALRETKRTGQEGHGMALAGVILGAITLIAGVFVVIIAFNDPSLYGDSSY